MLTNTLLLYVTQEALAKARARLARMTADRDEETGNALLQMQQKMRRRMDKTLKQFPTHH